MHHTRGFCGLVIVGATSMALLGAGCGDDDARGTSADAGAPDTSAPESSLAPDAGKPAPAFLDPADYTDFFTIDPSFPYGVTERHAAATLTLQGPYDDVLSAVRWGTTGPIDTATPSRSLPTVTRWSPPADPKGPATSILGAILTTGVPDGATFGEYGLVDLPFGHVALGSSWGYSLAYTGEALLFAPAPDLPDTLVPVSRAYVNGLVSGVGLTDGTTNEIVYSAFSTMNAAPSINLTHESGVYVAPLCDGQLLPSKPSCAPSHKLFGWNGSPSLVVSDPSGNVLVVAVLGTDESSAIELYGISKTQAFSSEVLTPALLGADTSSFNFPTSLAALAEPGATNGWLVATGWPGIVDGDASIVPSPAYAVDYTSAASGITRGAHSFAPVIVPGPQAPRLFVFNDDKGNLWVAVRDYIAGTFFKLEKRR